MEEKKKIEFLSKKKTDVERLQRQPKGTLKKLKVKIRIYPLG
jgi:hypothetical protein